MKFYLSLIMTVLMCSFAAANNTSGNYRSEVTEAALTATGLNETLILAQADTTLGPQKEEKDNKKATEETGNDKSEQTKKDESATAFTGSILTGASTIGGENFQQIGFRGEMAFGKLGIALDIMLQLDENGKVRKEDWDKFEDYLDKFYYVRWGHKGDPFYIKAGGLDFTYMGYGSSIYGYSNTVEYPTYKRTGMELAFNTKDMGGEFIFSNFKELINDEPSMIVGGRVYYNIFKKLSVGVSYAGDLNVNNGLRDDDGDGYPDEIDLYPYDSRYVTERDRHEKKLRESGLDETAIGHTIDQLVAADLLDPQKKSDLPRFNNDRDMINIIGADIGCPIIDKSYFKWEIYSQYATILEKKSWGFSLPGTRITIGDVRISADYRMTSDEFIFGFFNNTYELERASIDKTGSEMKVVTKLDYLDDVGAKKGFFLSIDFNILNAVTFLAGYQDLIKGEEHDRSLNAELKLRKGIIPFIESAGAYYIRNDFGQNLDNYFDEFTTWKTPGTIMGYAVNVEIGEGVIISFDYKYTFEDKNGNGKIAGDDETIKTFSITSSSRF